MSLMAKDVGGRPTKLNEAMIESLVAAVKRVLVTRHVAGLCGISHETIYAWFRQAKEDNTNGLTDTLHVRFSDAYKEALSEKVSEYILTIADRKTNWQANAWLLERCFREDFGQDAGIIADLAEKQNKLEALLTNKVEGASNDPA